MKNVLKVLLILVVALVAFIASRPATFHVERTAVLAAPPELVYAHIVDFHQWEQWSPWGKLDPAMKTEYTGPESGVGASYYWSGDKKVGEGRMTVTEATPASKVGIKLEFMKPFASVNACTFTLAPEGAGTKVVWAMDGHNNFVSKAVSLFMNMDKAIGPDFERGLAGLGHVSAGAAPAVPAATDSTTTPAAKP